VDDDSTVGNQCQSSAFHVYNPRKPDKNGNVYDLFTNNGIIWYAHFRKTTHQWRREPHTPQSRRALFRISQLNRALGRTTAPAFQAQLQSQITALKAQLPRVIPSATQAGVDEVGVVFDSLVKAFETLPPRPDWFYLFSCDRGYSSFDLAKYMVAHKVGFIISCRTDSPTWLFGAQLLPRLKKKADMACAYACDTSMAAMSLFDRGKVCMLTNMCDPAIHIEVTSTANRRGKTSTTTTRISKLLHSYRHWYHQVDRADQHVKQMEAKQRYIKWYQHNVNRLLSWMWYNAWKLSGSVAPLGEFLDKLETNLSDQGIKATNRFTAPRPSVCLPRSSPPPLSRQSTCLPTCPPRPSRATAPTAGTSTTRSLPRSGLATCATSACTGSASLSFTSTLSWPLPSWGSTLRSSRRRSRRANQPPRDVELKEPVRSIRRSRFTRRRTR